MNARARVIGQVYPWDLTDDPGRADALRQNGIDTVAIAANYHAVRAVSWINGSQPRLVTRTESSYFLPHSSDTWGSAMAPPSPTYRASDSELFGRAADSASRAGLGVQAWLVLTHDDSGPVDRVPHVKTIDPWGNVSPYALCSAHPDVIEYVRALVSNTVDHSGVRSFVVESAASPGFTHSLAHDKTFLSALSEFDESLLSLCCCRHCAQDAAADDWDAAELARLAREHFGGGSPPPERLLQLLHSSEVTRARGTARLISHLAGDVAGEPIAVTLYATTDLAAHTAFAPLVDAPPSIRSLCADLASPDGQGWIDLTTWSTTTSHDHAAVVPLAGGRTSLDANLRAHGATATGMRLVHDLYLYHVGMRRPDTLDSLSIRTSELLQPGEQ